jgi:hypothetical protein
MKLLKGTILSTTLVFNSAWATPPAVELKNILCNVGASAYSTGLTYAINGLSFDKGFEAVDGAANLISHQALMQILCIRPCCRITQMGIVLGACLCLEAR